MAWLLMPDSISETADLLKFSLETISRVDREWPEKDKYPVSGHSEGENALLMLGQKRMARLVRADRKATETQTLLKLCHEKLKQLWRGPTKY